ncbi:MAG: hypothetical protein ABI792_04950 [bacterium]
MPFKYLTVLTFLLTFIYSGYALSQELSFINFKIERSEDNILNKRISEDSNKISRGQVQKVNIGGLFVAPYVGASFPLGNFGNYSKSGIVYGAKFELAYSRLYPFVFGFVYEVQKNKGNSDFTTVNLLTQFDTKITSIGGSLDIILNKFIRSDFTTAIFSTEIKYAKVKRAITPSVTLPGIVSEESLLTYSAGLGFTIYILDLSGRYTFAKNFSNLTFQAKLHLPLIRF